MNLRFPYVVIFTRLHSGIHLKNNHMQYQRGKGLHPHHLHLLSIPTAGFIYSCAKYLGPYIIALVEEYVSALAHTLTLHNIIIHVVLKIHI